MYFNTLIGNRTHARLALLSSKCTTSPHRHLTTYMESHQQLPALPPHELLVKHVKSVGRSDSCVHGAPLPPLSPPPTVYDPSIAVTDELAPTSPSFKPLLYDSSTRP